MQTIYLKEKYTTQAYAWYIFVYLSSISCEKIHWFWMICRIKAKRLHICGIVFNGPGRAAKRPYKRARVRSGLRHVVCVVRARSLIPTSPWVQVLKIWTHANHFLLWRELFTNKESWPWRTRRCYLSEVNGKIEGNSHYCVIKCPKCAGNYCKTNIRQ